MFGIRAVEAMTHAGGKINGAMTNSRGDATKAGGVKVETLRMLSVRAVSTMSGVVINTVRDEMTNGGFKV